MHILFIGATSPTERNLIIDACEANTLDHKETLQPFTTVPLIQGPMGIMREAPREDLNVRVAREAELLNDLDPKKTAGIVLGTFGMHFAFTRFSIAERLVKMHVDIPFVVIEKPSEIEEVTRYYGGTNNVMYFEGVELAPPRTHIITKGPKTPEHIRAFVNLCARRLSAS